jgi:hypothetical protein
VRTDRDTLVVRDTIKIDNVKHDTSFHFNSTKDTIVIDKGRLQMKYYYSNDTVFLSGNCKDSVIIREIRVPIDKTIKVEKYLSDWAWLVIGLVFILLIMIGLQFRK